MRFVLPASCFVPLLGLQAIKRIAVNHAIANIPVPSDAEIITGWQIDYAIILPTCFTCRPFRICYRFRGFAEHNMMLNNNMFGSISIINDW